jgi:hypothetical protein
MPVTYRTVVAEDPAQEVQVLDGAVLAIHRVELARAERPGLAPQRDAERALLRLHNDVLSASRDVHDSLM